jgi:hypothetical protein
MLSNVKVTATDGFHPPVQVQMSRRTASEMMAAALYQGVIASCAIEGIRTDDIEPPDDSQLPNLPDSVLFCE